MLGAENHAPSNGALVEALFSRDASSPGVELSSDRRTATSTRNGWQHATLAKGFRAGCARWRWMLRCASGTECVLFGLVKRPVKRSNPLQPGEGGASWWTIDARDGALRACGVAAATTACRAPGGRDAGYGSTAGEAYAVEMGLDCERGELSLVVGETNYGVVFAGDALRGGQSAAHALWPAIAFCERGAAVELVTFEWFEAAPIAAVARWPALPRGQLLARRPEPSDTAAAAAAAAAAGPSAGPSTAAAPHRDVAVARSALRSQAHRSLDLEAQLLEASFAADVARGRATEALAECEAQRQRAVAAESALAAANARALEHRRAVERDLKATLAAEIGRSAAETIAAARRDAARGEACWKQERAETVALTEKLVNAAEARIATVERECAAATRRAAAADSRLAERMSTAWFMELVLEATAAGENGEGGGSATDDPAARDAVRDEVVHSWSADVAASDGEGRVEARVAAAVRRAIRQAIAARRDAARARGDAARARRDTRQAVADAREAQRRVSELQEQLARARRTVAALRAETEKSRAAVVAVTAAQRDTESELDIERAARARLEARLEPLLRTSAEDALHVEALAFELSTERAHFAAARARLTELGAARDAASDAARRADALEATLAAERAAAAALERRSRAALEAERARLAEQKERTRSGEEDLDAARAALLRVRGDAASSAAAATAAAVRDSVARQGELLAMAKAKERDAQDARIEVMRAQRQLRQIAHAAHLAVEAATPAAALAAPAVAATVQRAACVPSTAAARAPVSLRPARALVLSDTSTVVRVQMVHGRSELTPSFSLR